jgi:cation transport ATPase
MCPILITSSLAPVKVVRNDTGASICFVAYGGQLIGAIAVADAPRVEAAEAIQRLQARFLT